MIENDILSYYSMAEGRVRNEGGGLGLVLKMEYFITDQQGNTRVSFEDNNGTALLKQENSYYAFGMQMTGGYTPSANPNKKLYNAGSEWQDDIEGLADYYSTFFREYDPIIGRFNGVDPMSESFESWTTYHYSYNNPVNFNDPLGNVASSIEEMQREMQEEYRAWHDPLYGDNSSWSTLERQMSLWGWGDWSSSGGGGGSYAGSYQQLKDRINEYGHEGWREINADALREYFENLWSGTGRISIGVKESGGVNKGKGFNVGWYQDIPTSEGSRAAHGKFISIDEAVSLLSGEVGRGRDGLDNLQTGLGAFDVAWGAKEELINFAGKSSSAINNMKYVKGVKVVSKGLFWTQAGLSTYNAVSAWRNSDRDWTTNQGNKWGVTTKAALDIAIGAISLWGGPIGWIIGGAYFIADAAGAFDSWSKPEN